MGGELLLREEINPSLLMLKTSAGHPIIAWCVWTLFVLGACMVQYFSS